VSRIYDLWDIESGNIINTYRTEAEALAAVRDLLAVNDPSYAEALSLGFEQGDQQELIAEGAALAARAWAAAPKRAPRSA
jgi:hypothetical protein